MSNAEKNASGIKGTKPEWGDMVAGGMRDAVDDIRHKVVEEGVYGRQVTGDIELKGENTLYQSSPEVGELGNQTEAADLYGQSQNQVSSEDLYGENVNNLVNKAEPEQGIEPVQASVNADDLYGQNVNSLVTEQEAEQEIER